MSNSVSDRLNLVRANVLSSLLVGFSAQHRQSVNVMLCIIYRSQTPPSGQGLILRYHFKRYNTRPERQYSVNCLSLLFFMTQLTCNKRTLIFFSCPLLTCDKYIRLEIEFLAATRRCSDAFVHCVSYRSLFRAVRLFPSENQSADDALRFLCSHDLVNIQF